ncbi:MAG: relaxase domain-containing protein, partial [Planctomycetota bacterium]
MSSGQQSYYTQLAREDYYLEGGEPPGQWRGQGAEALSLFGEVSP